MEIVNNESVLNMYFKEIDKYERLTREEVLEEYKNIDLKKQMNILKESVLDADKLFGYISSYEEFNVVNKYIRKNYINKYPQTKEDKELISKLREYEHNYNDNDIDVIKELEMYEKYKTSREKIINANLKLVLSIAKPYATYCDLSELIAAGNEGLVLATDKYDSSSDHAFATYATFWIRREVLIMLNEKSKLIRIPMNVKMDNVKIAKQLEELEKTKGLNLTLDEIAKELKIKKKRLIKFYEYSKTDMLTSLDSEVNEECDEMGKFIEDPKDPYAEINNCTKEILEEILEVLTDRERFVIEHRNGINSEKETLQAIGEQLKITHQAVRLIEGRAMAKLKARGKRISRLNY